MQPYLRRTTWPIIAAMLALMAMSLLAVAAAEGADPAQSGCLLRQAIWVPVALAAFAVVSAVPFQRVGPTAYAWFALNLALLVAVLFLPRIQNSHRWINLGLFKLQPSELAKLTFVMALAWYLRYRDNYRRVLGLVPPFVLTVVPTALILIEPDLGTSLLLFPTLFFMLLAAGAKLRHLLGVVIVSAVVVLCPVPQDLSSKGPEEAEYRAALAYWPRGQARGVIRGKYVLAPASLAFMKYYQLTRVGGWLRQSAESVASNEGYQLQQSKIVLSSGGWAGWDQMRGRTLYLQMLPDDHTDFIFAVIGGRWGFAGCAGVIALYLVIFMCGAEIAAGTPDPFARLLVVGVIALLFSQILINVGMTVGLMPITGMTLPLVSYGGSSLVANAMGLGLVVNVARRRPILLGRRPFEYGQKPEEKPTYETLVETPPGERPRPRRR